MKWTKTELTARILSTFLHIWDSTYQWLWRNIAPWTRTLSFNIPNCNTYWWWWFGFKGASTSKVNLRPVIPIGRWGTSKTKTKENGNDWKKYAMGIWIDIGPIYFYRCFAISCLRALLQRTYFAHICIPHIMIVFVFLTCYWLINTITVQQCLSQVSISLPSLRTANETNVFRVRVLRFEYSVKIILGKSK